MRININSTVNLIRDECVRQEGKEIGHCKIVYVCETVCVPETPISISDIL